jgi:hypothetical protein
MAIKISVLESYILVEPDPGLDYWDILEGSIKLSNMKEFAEKNDIWIFKPGPLMLTIKDLYKIQDIISEHYPKVPRERKTAVVVESGFMSGLVNTFTELSNNLPFRLKVFDDLSSAEKWVI